jgi:hypothetical protein
MNGRVPADRARRSPTSANRILFVVLAGVLVLLVGAMLALAGGTPEGPSGILAVVRLVGGVAVVLIVIRLVLAALRR